MSFKDLAIAILNLSTSDLDKPAVVWPPSQCPATEFVPVAGLEKNLHGAPVISTGKQPTG